MENTKKTYDFPKLIFFLLLGFIFYFILHQNLTKINEVSDSQESNRATSTPVSFSKSADGTYSDGHMSFRIPQDWRSTITVPVNENTQGNIISFVTPTGGSFLIQVQDIPSAGKPKDLDSLLTLLKKIDFNAQKTTLGGQGAIVLTQTNQNSQLALVTTIARAYYVIFNNKYYFVSERAQENKFNQERPILDLVPNTIYFK